VGWFRVERGGAACTLVLVYMSIRLSETVSEFRSIERRRTPDTVQHSRELSACLSTGCNGGGGAPASGPLSLDTAVMYYPHGG